MRPASPFAYSRQLDGLPYILYLEPSTLAMTNVAMHGLHSQEQWCAEATEELVAEILAILRWVWRAPLQMLCVHLHDSLCCTGSRLSLVCGLACQLLRCLQWPLSQNGSLV